MGEIVRLEETLVLPLPDTSEKFYDWARQLVGELNKNIGEETNTTVNLLLDQQGNTAMYYFGVPDEHGEYANGVWRLNASDSTEYLIQLKESGSWVTKYSLTKDSLVTVANLILSGLSISRIVVTDENKQLASADIVDWIAGTENQVIVTDDEDGSVTLSLPQNIDTGADVVFNSITVSAIIAASISVTNASITNASITNLTTTGGRVSGTTRITVTDSPYTVLATDNFIYCDTVNGGIEVVLPAGVDGTTYWIKNLGGYNNDVTITPNGTEEIEGDDDAILGDRWSYTLQFETTENWRVA